MTPPENIRRIKIDDIISPIIIIFSRFSNRLAARASRTGESGSAERPRHNSYVPTPSEQE
jgi:hypothetical protein